MHYRMFHSVPGLHPLDPSSTPPAGTAKVSPDVANVPGGENRP